MRISNRSSADRRALKPISAVFAVVAVALALAACGSSGSGSGSGSSGSGTSGPANSSQTTQTTQTAHATLTTTKVAGYGTVLATGKGAPVYLLTADPKGGSSCTGSCAGAWPPLTVTGKPTAGSGVDASMLSTFKRTDGSAQVLYNGHALYTHPGLSATAAAGSAANGGIWYLVSPSGKAITKTTGSGY